MAFLSDDMIAFAEKAMAYSQGLDQKAFESSGLNYDATVRNLELIGEAARHIPERGGPAWRGRTKTTY
jgi:uncharacterized protein with HEPN domain